ncbi:hypothetical protein ACFO3D_08195 [Virgibacillus kekensis]|uniref:DUF1440 domain-containing protein n=1 Tax=Virgibacillus kekensis TaxID=202261 RepID=A0ABV9DHJ3_9BACI
MRLVKLTAVGLIAGLILGGLLKMAEQLTGKKVYTLLMNVDYIPVIRKWNMTGAQEFMLHLVVAVLLVFTLYILLKKYYHPLTLYISINLIVGGLLYLTTVLSARTPELTDMEAFSYWMLGHFIYGLSVGIMVRKIEG